MHGGITTDIQVPPHSFGELLFSICLLSKHARSFYAIGLCCVMSLKSQLCMTKTIIMLSWCSITFTKEECIVHGGGTCIAFIASPIEFLLFDFVTVFCKLPYQKIFAIINICSKSPLTSSWLIWQSFLVYKSTSSLFIGLSTCLSQQATSPHTTTTTTNMFLWLYDGLRTAKRKRKHPNLGHELHSIS